MSEKGFMDNGKRKGFLVIAHGSRKEEANRRVFELVRRLRGYFQSSMFEAAFMELAKPSIEDGIRTLVEKGADELVAFPFFLFKGMHYSKDVPGIIEAAIDTLDRDVSVRMMEPLGMHPQVFDLVQEMLYEEAAGEFEFTRVDPSEIEDRSMDIIESCLDGADLPVEEKPIVKRVVHTTGDFDFARNMVFHRDAVSEGRKAVREKRTVFTDVTMVQAGINKRFGHVVRCVLNEPGVAERARSLGLTRAACGIRSIGRELDGNIVVVGNAPTALITLVDMIRRDNLRPALVVGIPVGFVNAKESKEYLASLDNGVPYITNRGHKGGSTVAAAIVNALIKMEFTDREQCHNKEVVVGDRPVG